MVQGVFAFTFRNFMFDLFPYYDIFNFMKYLIHLNLFTGHRKMFMSFTDYYFTFISSQFDFINNSFTNLYSFD